MNKNAFRKISYGVYIVSVMDGERPTGCTANCAMQITSDPAVFAVSINHNNYTNGCIRKSGKFTINILPETVNPLIIGTFGFRSGKDFNKFEKFAFDMIEGTPILRDGCAYIICEVIDTAETDTHTIFLGKVVDADELSDGEPMTYAYYHKVVKGKSAKNAPTFISEEKSKT